MYNIYRKNYLGSNLEKMRKAFPDEYSFYPKTWLLPNDYIEIVNMLKSSAKQNLVLIAKPCDKSQGKGIFLITSPTEVPQNEKLVVQTYINK